MPLKGGILVPESFWVLVKSLITILQLLCAWPKLVLPLPLSLFPVVFSEVRQEVVCSFSLQNICLQWILQIILDLCIPFAWAFSFSYCDKWMNWGTEKTQFQWRFRRCSTAQPFSSVWVFLMSGACYSHCKPNGCLWQRCCLTRTDASTLNICENICDYRVIIKIANSFASIPELAVTSSIIYFLWL